MSERDDSAPFIDNEISDEELTGQVSPSPGRGVVPREAETLPDEAPRARGQRVGSLVPSSFEEAMQLAIHLSRSNLVPADYRDKPENCLVAMEMGAEIGLRPFQAVQNIAVINGRPCVWGDAVPGICYASGVCDYIKEWFEGEGEELTAWCETKRRGAPDPIRRSFSMADAHQAGLLGRPTWKLYPKRMLQMRARGFCLRDAYPDYMKGLGIAEDLIDVEPTRTTAVVEPKQGASDKASEVLKTAKAKAESATAAAEQAADEAAGRMSVEKVEKLMVEAESMAELTKVAEAHGRDFSGKDRERLKKAYRERRDELMPKGEEG